MQYRPLGPAGPNVSEVGFGVWTVATRMWGITDVQIGIKLLREAFDLGITFFDTADVYGDGLGETILQDAFGPTVGDLVIATKFGYDFYNHPGVQAGQRERPQDWSPQFVRRACEESLKRLGRDNIDLYQLHNPRADAIANEALWNELDRLKRDGKVTTVGVALGPALKPDRQCDEGIMAIQQRGVSVQIIYNMLEQPLGEAIFPAARAAGTPVVARVPHASGLLEGHYTTDTTFAADDHRQHRVPTDEARRNWLLNGLKKVEALEFLTANGARTMGQAALQFILSEPSIASTLPNIYDSTQLAEFADAPNRPALSSWELECIAALYSADFHLASSRATA